MGGTVPSYTGEKAKQLTQAFNLHIRTKVRNATRSEVQEKLQTHVNSLQVQGRLLALVSQEKEDLLWKSTLFQLKSGSLRFMLNASIYTLNTPANL